jgi:hypothetical protein
MWAYKLRTNAASGTKGHGHFRSRGHDGKTCRWRNANYSRANTREARSVDQTLLDGIRPSRSPIAADVVYPFEKSQLNIVAHENVNEQITGVFTIQSELHSNPERRAHS